MPAPRTLSFDTLGQSADEAERLLASGYTPRGKWSLGQACRHMSIALDKTLQPQKKAPWILRKILAGPMLKRIIKKGAMPSGMKGPRDFMPAPDDPLDDRAEVAAYRDAVNKFLRDVPGEIDHPFFDRISGADLTRLQCIHAALHLGFLEPKA